MNLFKPAIAGLCFAAACSAVAAPFAAKPGVWEFTGELIVRPIPASSYISQGMAASVAVDRTNGAFRRLSSMARRTISETGELVVRVPAGSNENDASRQIMATGLYEYAIPNWRLFPVRTPNDPRFGQQWHHRVMRSERGWDLHTGGSRISIGIVDTGVDQDHPDLMASLLPGYNSADRKRQVDGANVDDTHSHGTHVAGCATAIGNNGIGVAGSAWGLKIIPIKASNAPSGGASMDDLLDGARWAATNGARVVNVSYSGVDAEAIQTTGAFLRTISSQLVWAAGNDNRDLVGFDHQDVIVVGASNPADAKAGFSAYGRAIDVFAPGEGILSSVPGGGYAAFSGTSMASPVAAGVVGLILSYNPRLSPVQAEQILARTATKIGPDTIFGNGRVDTFAAMVETQRSLTVAEDVLASAVTPQGTVAGGSLASMTTVDSNSYRISSVKFALGQISAATLDFNVANAGKLAVVQPTIVATVSRTSQPVTGTLFLWNYAARRFDSIHTAALPVAGTASIGKEFSIASFKNYVNAAGQVKLMMRAHTADSRLTGPAPSFSLSLNRVVLRVERTQ